MNYPAKTPNIINSGLPVFLILLVSILTGCVDADGSKIFSRSTEKLHTYKANDFIEYTVTGTRSATNTTTTTRISGTLRVEWHTHQPLIDPVEPDNAAIDVLEQRSILKIGDETPQVSRRLISQDDSGTIYLHAFSGINGTTLYWVDDETSDSPVSLDRINTLGMPLTLNTTGITVDFNLFENCNITAKCDTYLGYLNEIYTIENEHFSLETRAGTFDSYRVGFAGMQQFLPGRVIETSSFPVILDLRSSCSAENAQYTGSKYIFPEIGMVFQSVTCLRSDSTQSGFTYQFEYTGAGGSITLPSNNP